jgi:hypothetical protein
MMEFGSMKRSRLFARAAAVRAIPALALALAVGLFAASAPAAEPGLKAQSVWPMDRAEWLRAESQAESALMGRFGARSNHFEILSLDAILPEAGESWGDKPTGWRAVVYDYAAEKAHVATLDWNGRVLSEGPYKSNVFANQPVPGEREFENAVNILREHSVYGPALARGLVEPYKAMPPVDYAPGAPRTLHVGLMPVAAGAQNEIVGVVMRTSQVKSFERGAPLRAKTRGGACGPSSGFGCSNSSGGSGILNVQWPSVNPVWTLDIVRPDATQTSATPDGSGAELRNVRYNGEMILLSANVPVLNVKYDGDTCGPFRDWLFEEDCFDGTGGTQVAQGFYRTTSEIATICVDGTDNGNIEGVGIQDTANALVIVSEMRAGWYRYLVGWRLFDNGDIKADFYYAGTFNGCTCQPRTHHAYWRFDFALGGVANAGTPGGWDATNIFERRASVGGPWSQISQEGTFLRELDLGEPEFRVSNPTAEIAYEFIASKADSTVAGGNPYGKSDVWLLDWDASETHDDGGFDTSIDLDPYFAAPETVNNERLVVWYGGHLRQDGGPTGGSNTCAAFGPLLRRVELQVPVELSAFGLD